MVKFWRFYHRWGWTKFVTFWGAATMAPAQQNATTSSSIGCSGDTTYLADGYCDVSTNMEECDWDGGDCCDCTCTPSTTFDCGYNGYDCQDPGANCSSDGVSSALIGGICAACVVVLLAVGAGVYYIQARKRRDSAPGKAPPVQYPVPHPAGSGGGESAVGGQTSSAQYPVALNASAPYPVSQATSAQYPVAS